MSLPLSGQTLALEKHITHTISLCVSSVSWCVYCLSYPATDCFSLSLKYLVVVEQLRRFPTIWVGVDFFSQVCTGTLGVRDRDHQWRCVTNKSPVVLEFTCPYVRRPLKRDEGHVITCRRRSLPRKIFSIVRDKDNYYTVYSKSKALKKCENWMLVTYRSAGRR